MEKFGAGQAVRRREDERFLRGRGRYLDDIALAGMAHAAVLRSPHAHARIRAIDTRAARKAPGVAAVFTAGDLQAAGLGAIPTVTEVEGVDERGIRHPPRFALTGDVARYVGDPVAFVVAETRMQARDAAERIEVEYEELPAVVDLARALEPETAAIWPQFGSNLCFRFRMGDAAAVDRAFAGAAHRVDLAFVNNRLAPCAIEPRGAIGDFEADDDRHLLYVSGQGVHSQRAQMAASVFKVAPERIRVVAPDVGGGFGAKNFVYPENVLAMLAAKALGRPVKWVAERGESFLAETHGRDHRTTAELALDRNGRFLALRIHTLANMGAYLSTYAAIIPTSASWVSAGGNYAIPAVDMEVKGVFTNTVPVDAYRGAGRPKSAYLIERLVDVAAQQLGFGPDALRRRNLIRTFPYRTALGMEVDTGGFAENLERAILRSGWADAELRRRDAEARGKLYGRGLSSYLEVTLGSPAEDAEIRFEADGGIALVVGTQSTGQGHETAYVQILAGALGIPPERVRFLQGDTTLSRSGGGHGGSRSLTTGGSAVQRVGAEVLEKGRRAAAHLFGAAPEEVEFADGLYAAGGSNRRMSVLEVAKALRDAKDLPPGIPASLDSRSRFERNGYSFPNGCHVADVEVDPETGGVEVTGYTIVDDFGTIVNPLIAAGQAVGGSVQGIGQALQEEVVYDRESGQLLTGSLMDYALPRAADVCGFDVSFNEDAPTRINPLGVKGAGEAGATGAPAAVVNAVIDALRPFGVRHIDMPLTPEKVWRSIRSRERGAR